MSTGFRVGRVRVQGQEAHYREAGAGPPVLLLAGLGLSSRFYEPLAHRFAAAGLRLLVADPPGFGGTPGRVLGHGVGELAEFHAAFARAMELGHAVWLGHSLGAQVAIRVAAEPRNRVRGLVLAAPSGAPAHLLRLRQMGALALTATRVRPGILAAVLAQYAGNNPIRVAATWLRAARDRPADHAARITAPTLLLVGGRDPIPGDRYLNLLRQRIRDVRTEVVPGATHALPREAPDAFTAAVAAFARGLPV